ncbi:methyltransferase [Vibrio parahaemolyticus]|uniref:adenine-specific DNA-methyltransferase n=1 Tax=Vibrio parahaemolyticus TaxID=670 RepID=UPI00054307CD|nr:adenine-specific DNA-methyltransferase [Vibrio parahaemolyticus]KHF14363.1 methyltransferase [Vibrio parahaemolyticus]OTW01608.1 methyltransferase [Vibrio parahaemolyticus]OTW07207.1 methyltransferase [Vibrio parahaemolyticus]
MIFTTDDKRHTIYQGDVLESLKQLPDNSVDLIFADPPYNIGKDFDGLKEDWSEQDFLDWAYQWIDECHRVLATNGTFYLMNSTENMPFLDIYCRTKFNVTSRIVWSYDSSGVQAKRYYGSLYEPILMLTKGKSYTFNYEDIMVEAKTGAKRQLMDYRKNPPQPYNTKKVPGNVWEFPRVRFKMEEYENHPTQKPEILLERVIKASSNEDDIVLDPFSGSFSTCAVAKRLNRRSIGIEINPEYVKMGLRRVDVPSHYTEEELEKVKKRKTTNTSKKVRTKTKPEQVSAEAVQPDLI